MPRLHRFPGGDPNRIQPIDDPVSALAALGLRLERWPARDLRGLADVDILALYGAEIAATSAAFGFQVVDVFAVPPDHPERAALRARFRAEHHHPDFEVRVFAQGGGALYLRAGGDVYRLDCADGDWLSLPAGVPHWFEMGADADVRILRFFVDGDGWRATFTGSDLPDRFASA